MTNWKIFLLLAPILFSTRTYSADHHSRKSQGHVERVLGSPGQSIMDINNITSWVRDDGIFDYLVASAWNGTYPKGTAGTIFTEGILWGGLVQDGRIPALRVGGS